jgi:hypothetical protein
MMVAASMHDSGRSGAYGEGPSRGMRKILFLVPLWLLPAVAEARPRDEVMSGIYRCAPISDSRHWLDCYYGAAQPARAPLGLPPALASQIQLAVSPPSGGMILDGEIRNRVMVAASRCYAVANDREWLDCYYGAAGPMRSALGLATPASREYPKQEASLPPEHARSELDFTKITSKVEDFQFDRSRNFRITLSNGQAWQQVAGDTSYAHWKKPPGSYIAVITHGAFGSFNLQMKGSPLIFKVRPVQ